MTQPSRLRTKASHASLFEAGVIVGYLQLTLDLILKQESREDVTPLGHLVDLLRRQSTLLQKAGQSRLLLHGILWVASQLGQSLEIVLGAHVLDALGGLLDRLGGSLDVLDAVAGHVLGEDGVDCLDGAGLGAQAATGDAKGTGLAVHVVDDGFLAAATGVGLGGLGALGEELDGRVAGYFLRLRRGFAVLGFGVDLCDQDGRLGGEVGGYLLPDGGEGLAV